MKKNANNLSRLKHQLFQMRNARRKNPIWKLNQEQVEFVIRLGFGLTPVIYRINTQAFNNVQNMSGIFKEIHYSKVKDNKNVIFKKLRPSQVKALRTVGVTVVPYKYEIYLQN